MLLKRPEHKWHPREVPQKSGSGATMKDQRYAHLPRAKDDSIVVQDIGEEVLAYNTETGEAHCLNPQATAVWTLCDGATSIEQIAADLGTNAENVWLAIEQLEEANLLVERVEKPQHYSRRNILAKLALAAAAVPLVSTLALPAPAEAASGRCTDVTCTSGCSGGLTSGNTCPAACTTCLGDCWNGNNGCGGAITDPNVNCPACVAICTGATETRCSWRA